MYCVSNNSIQFICIAHFHKLQICLGVLYNLYTDIPVPEPHIGSGKTPKQPFTGEKKGRTLQESNRGGSLSKIDRCICNVCRRTELELKHIQWIWQSVWIVRRMNVGYCMSTISDRLDHQCATFLHWKWSNTTGSFFREKIWPTGGVCGGVADVEATVGDRMGVVVDLNSLELLGKPRSWRHTEGIQLTVSHKTPAPGIVVVVVVWGLQQWGCHIVTLAVKAFAVRGDRGS